MKTFIGTKIIQAEPMDKHAFESECRGMSSQDENAEGYHVVYPQLDPKLGYYHSWSPKAEFENAYREMAATEKDMVLKGIPLPLP